MTEWEIHIDRHPGEFIILPDGMFKLTNPQDIIPGRIHTFRYNRFDQFATIVAISL